MYYVNNIEIDVERQGITRLLRTKIIRDKSTPPIEYVYTGPIGISNLQREAIINRHAPRWSSLRAGLTFDQLLNTRYTLMEGWAERMSDRDGMIRYDRCHVWPQNLSSIVCLHIFFLEKLDSGEAIFIPETIYSTEQVAEEEEPSPFTESEQTRMNETTPQVRTPITYSGRRRRRNQRRRRFPTSFGSDSLPQRHPSPTNIIPSDLNELMNTSSPSTIATHSRVVSPDLLTGEPAASPTSSSSNTSSDVESPLWFGFELPEKDCRPHLRWSVSTRTNVVKELHELARHETMSFSKGGWANSINSMRPVEDEPGLDDGANQDMITYYFQEMLSSHLFEEGDQELKLPRRWLQSSQLEQLQTFGQLLAVACYNKNYPQGYHPIMLAIGFLQTSFTQSDTENLPALLKLYDTELSKCFALDLDDFLNYDPYVP